MDKEAKVTLTFYLFEKTLEALPNFKHLCKKRKILELQVLADLVWLAENGRGAVPVVSAASGPKSHFWHEERKITLIPKHRNAAGVLHEMAHALGVRDKQAHGPAFRTRCLRLYRDYGDWDGTVDFDRGKKT